MSKIYKGDIKSKDIKLEFGNLYLYNLSKCISQDEMNSFYDSKTLNYHIYPKEEYKNKYLCEFVDKLIVFHHNICEAVKNIMDEKNTRFGRGISAFPTSKYCMVEYDEFAYWLCYEQFFIEVIGGNECVSSIAGKIQYFRTLTKDDSINTKQDIMYPVKGDMSKVGTDGRMVVNTEFTLDSPIDDVLNDFVRFYKNPNQYINQD